MHTSTSQPADGTRDLEQIILDVIRENLLQDLPADCATNADLFAAGLDSMGIMQMVLLLEERFSCTVQPADLTRLNFSTAIALATLVRSKDDASSV
ncbi:MAG: acyl carrier protein [Nitrospirota bacterium]|nr:acyl carrier protein [Nitrospirota bacterium]MDH5585913.1 acyl carrier protein [Nitrospirota bacterium]MDH5773982.1 acyl carrier protein [Nitrospirota bacterium]